MQVDVSTVQRQILQEGGTLVRHLASVEYDFSQY